MYMYVSGKFMDWSTTSNGTPLIRCLGNIKNTTVLKEKTNKNVSLEKAITKIQELT